MSKAILEFDLPEENNEFKQAINAQRFRCALWDIKEKYREHRKHREPNQEYETPMDLLEDLEKEFYEILTDNDINENDLI